MKALDRKLLRDLVLLWSQALTIALVVASGIAGFLTTLSAVDSLAAARERFYAEGRFADVFATVKRAPNALLPQLLALPGVADAQAGTEFVVRVEIEGRSEPIVGQLIGLDAREPRRMNRVVVRDGRAGQAPSPGGVLAEARLAAVGAGQRQAAHAGHGRGGPVAGIRVRRPVGHARPARFRGLLGRP